MNIIKRIHLTDLECMNLMSGEYYFYCASPSSCFRLGQLLTVLPMSSKGAQILNGVNQVRIMKLTPVIPMFEDDDCLKVSYLPLMVLQS